MFKDQPVSFRVRVLPCPTGESSGSTPLDRHMVPSRSNGPKDSKVPSSSSSGLFFSCFGDSSLCFTSDYTLNEGNVIAHADYGSTTGSIPSSGSSISQLYYSKLDEVVHSSEECHLRTKKPAWNSELQRWIHHFGGRIKMASNNNFLLVHDESSPSAEDLDGLGLGMGGGIFKNTESQVLQYATDYNRGDVIVRHGKVPFHLHVLGDFSSHGSCAFPFPLLYPIYIDHEEYLHRGLQRADFRFGCLGHRGCSANPERSRASQVEKEKMRIIREKFFSTRGSSPRGKIISRGTISRAKITRLFTPSWELQFFLV